MGGWTLREGFRCIGLVDTGGEEQAYSGTNLSQQWSDTADPGW